MDKRTQRSAYVERVLGETTLRSQEYENFLAAAELDARRKALIAILKSFDEFCVRHGIGYFLFGQTLQGTISYDDFVPGKGNVEIGMMQADYDKFCILYRDITAKGEVVSDFWVLQRHLVERPHVLHRFPRLVVRRPVPVVYEGRAVFSHESFPLEVLPYAEISIFNAVPDDFFTRKKFFRQMQRRNHLYELTLAMREIMAREQPQSAVPFVRGLLSSVLPLRVLSNIIARKARKYEGKGMLSMTRVRQRRTQTVEIARIAPYQRHAFGGITVNVPSDTTIWAPDPLDTPTRELKRLQEAALKIVEEIHRICTELDIGYFACGGTMLGYVRHGGFIPWDDDIDVGMLREDYERFKKEAPALLDTDTFFLQTRESDPNIPYLFSKIRLNGTQYLTAYNVNRDFHKGICVDIFPFDALPNSTEAQAAFQLRVQKRIRAHNRVANRQYPEVSMPSGTRRKNLDWLIAQTTGRLLARHYWKKSLADTQAAYNEIVETYDACAKANHLEYVASFVPTYTMVRLADLLPYQTVEFEGIKVNVPANPDVFLTMQYGDYFALPPRHQRSGHDLLAWGAESPDEGMPDQLQGKGQL